MKRMYILIILSFMGLFLIINGGAFGISELMFIGFSFQLLIMLAFVMMPNKTLLEEIKFPRRIR